MRPSHILKKYNNEYYLASLSIKPQIGDQILLTNGISVAVEENVLDALKIVKTTLDNTLNREEIERLLVTRLEDETAWVVGFTKQNYLTLLM